MVTLIGCAVVIAVDIPLLEDLISGQAMYQAADVEKVISLTEKAKQGYIWCGVA